MEREQKRVLAANVRRACEQALRESYEVAKMRGMCDEGAWEFALSYLRSLDPEQLLEEAD